MKRMIKLSALLLLCAVLFSSCVLPEGFFTSETTTQSEQNPAPQEKPDENPDPTPNPDPEPEPEPTPKPDPEPDLDVPQHLYNDFTDEEKAIWTQYIGALIPFIPNDEYIFEAFSDVDDFENGIYFSTTGNTQAEFDAYRALFSDYALTDTYEDGYGATWYTYEKDGVVVDLTYYFYENEHYVEVYVYSDLSANPDGGGDDGEGGDTPPADTHLFTDFTDEQKAIWMQYIGTVIPFIPNNNYVLEGYYDVDDFENGIYFSTTGNTQAEFDAYRALFSDYALTDTYEDTYGDTWYTYEKDSVVVDLSYYFYEGVNYVDVYVYSDLSADPDEGGDGGEGGDTPPAPSTPDGVITNEGAGLPADTDGVLDGVLDVDLTDAEYVKNATEQATYLDGCPTTGSPAVLVIPVEFSDAPAQDRGYSLDALQRVMTGTGNDTAYYSLREYYRISSYGALTLDVTVVDAWFRPQHPSSYYKNATMEYYGDTVAIGDQMILDEALAYLATVMDLSAFDSDGNGTVDAVIMVNTLDIDADETFQWAYRYWNIYCDEDDYYYEYDGVYANDYIWMSYQFMYELYSNGSGMVVNPTSALDTYTFIHEFGHILGADDYYDTAGVHDPLAGYDVMDAMAGDHNPYTKFHYGWLTASRLIIADGSVTLTLEDFSASGDTVILANNWDPALGAYQEYYVLMYYTGEGLNAGLGGYFDEDGILVYHVNAPLTPVEYGDTVYYDVYNTNTDPSDPYGSENDLISFVLDANGEYVFGVGDSLPATYDDCGDLLSYTFTVDSLDGEHATLTFEKVA